jgi:hypothetical protein
MEDAVQRQGARLRHERAATTGEIAKLVGSLETDAPHVVERGRPASASAGTAPQRHMAKIPPDAQSDPMAREVDRLLAQLSRGGPLVDDGREAPPPQVSRRAAGGRSTSTAAAIRTRESARHQAVGLWSWRCE